LDKIDCGQTKSGILDNLFLVSLNMLVAQYKDIKSTQTF